MLSLVTAVLGVVSLVSAIYPAFNNHMLPCPSVHPRPDVNINKLLGSWHLTMIVVDATEEEFVESGVCISGELQRHNKTVVRQVWTMQAEEETEPIAVLELPISVVSPGVWTVQTPLGGEVKAIVFGYDPKAYALVSHCGWHLGELLHLWTAVITRTRVISPTLRYHLTSLLEDNGFDPYRSKVISWEGC